MSEEERHLEDRLHALARGVDVPMVPAGADVRRGRRRLVRMRLAVAGATAGTLAVVVGVAGLTAGDPTATEAPVVTQPPSGPSGSTAPSSTPDAAEAGAAGHGQGRGQEDDRDVASAPTSGPASVATDADAVADDTAKHGDGSAPGHGPNHWPTGTTQPTEEPTGEPTEATTDEPTQEPSATPTPTPTATPTTEPTTTPTGTPTTEPTVPPTTGKVRLHKVLAYFDDVLAGSVDPDRDHLQPYDRTVDDHESVRLGGRWYAVGSSYRWTGAKVTDALGVRVATGWDQVDWECGATPSVWDCAAGTQVGVELATHDGLREVAVEHADGQVVVVSTDVSAADLADDDLVAAATDDRLVVPGDAPVAPPTLDGGAFGASGEAALVRDGESFTTTAYDRAPSVRGTWAVAGTDRGTLSWSAAPIYSGGGWVCLTSYKSCSDVVVDAAGTVVHVGVLKKKAGFVLQYDGPSYAVRVTSSDPTFAKKRAYPFLVDPGWQPVR